MIGNPEFRRNLVLELTAHRLIAVPLVLGLIFATTWAIDGPRATAGAGRMLMTILLALWGARAAADAVFGEVADRTWDAQRMSSIGPWTMSWGKLFGATSFSWYGALCCAPAVLAGPEAPVNALIEIVLFGLLAHAVALLISLLLLRIRPKRTRFQVNIAHAGGILIALAVGGVGTYQTGPAQDLVGEPFLRLAWYGIPMGLNEFSFFTRLIVLAWTVVGIWRLMRLELQFKPQPLVWLAFVLFVSAYVGGVSFQWQGGVAAPAWVETAGRLGAGLVFIVLLTYGSAFLAPSGGVTLRRLAWDLRAGRGYAAFREAPPWMVAALVAIIQAAAISVVALSASDPSDLALDSAARLAGVGAGGLVIGLVAWMLFMVRDLALIQFVILSPRARRGHLAAALYLAILYGALPALLGASGLQSLLPALVPFAVRSPLGLLPILLQLMLLGLALAWRWRQITAIQAEAPAAA